MPSTPRQIGTQLLFGLISGLMLVQANSFAASGEASNAILTQAEQAAKEEYAYSVATQAYVFTFPLTMTERERKVRLKPRPANPFAPVAPVNQLGHMRQLANAKAPLPYSPNFDTLYSGGVLELQDDPIVMHVPDIKDRYFSIEVTDAYTSNLPYQLGSRISGGKGGEIIFVGPNWKGTIPKGMHVTRAPSNSLLLALRLRINGPEDLPNVTKLQDQFSLTSLKDWDNGRGMGKTIIPIPTSVMTRPDYKGDFAYFKTVADLMTENPPTAEHAGMLKKMEFLGLVPGQPFKPETLDEPTRRGILRAEKGGFDIIKWSTRERGFRLPSNWSTQLTGGTYGVDYLGRAEDAYSGLIQHDLIEAMYFITYADGKGQPLVGGKRYRLHFNKGYLPATMPQGFWSFTLYDGNRYQYIDNPLNRYSLGANLKNLKFNADGSLDLYVQPESPGADKESNWLPSAKSGPLRMNIRCYLPAPAMMDMKELPKHIPAVEEITD